jgi:hypothetical protein
MKEHLMQGTKVKDLINILQKVEPNKDIIFYHLKDYNLQGCELESFLDIDKDFVELTLKNIDSDEGGIE